MRIFITGGAGFIGSGLIENICTKKNEITLYDRNLNEKKLPNGKYKVVERDFFEEENFQSLLKGQDIVVHLISGVNPSSSMSNIKQAYQKDLLKTLEMIEAAQKEGVQKIIFVSSGGTVYGESNEKVPFKEDVECNPINHYGIMKLSIEKILLMYNKVFGMENVILRVANPYGKGQVPDKKIGAISIFMHHIQNDLPITIYGDGEVVRDYVEIKDVCKAIALAFEYNVKQHDVLPIFNIGTGSGTSLKELIRKIESLTLKKAIINYVQNRGIDVEYNVLSIEKAQEYLGFQSQVQIDQGIKEFYKGNYEE